MTNPDVVTRIQIFNQGRNPDGLKRKYQKMAKNAFAFLRGTCHLFYEDLPIEGIFQSAPVVWSCGDLHLENFGTFKGDDRLVYFDINDFDEAVLAPCTWDLVRLVTSILVATEILKISEIEAHQLCLDFLEVYSAELATGKDRTVKRETATGLVKNLLDKLQMRYRKGFLDERTELQGKKRQFKLIKEKITPATQDEKQAVTTLIDRWASQQSHPKFYQVLDVAHRIAGTSSLGLDRYIILVEGKGSPDQNYLLDLKLARSSSLSSPSTQPVWSNEAERITALQFRTQESPPALLNPVLMNGQAFVLRELQPTEDKVELSDTAGNVKLLKKLITTMAQVTAWGQLRSRGRQGSAIADDLITFANRAPDWHPPLLDYAHTYAQQVKQDYESFCKSKLVSQ